MKLLICILEKLLNIIIEKTDGFCNIRAKRIYFTKAEKGDRFPSDSPYDEEHPINFYIMHNCLNARIFIDAKRVFYIPNISKFRFITFVWLNELLSRIGQIYLFRLTDKQKNGLAHTHKTESDYPPSINIIDEYEIIKRYNKDIDYMSEKKYLDKFLKKNNITHTFEI